MQILRFILGKSRKNRRQTIAQYQRELLINQGREQFKKLIDSGLGVPVGLL